MGHLSMYFLILFIFSRAGEYSAQEITYVAPSDDQGDASKTVAEYITGNGYEFQEHKVITEDGYILTLWRMHRNKTANGPPIILQHGVVDAGFTFLLSGNNHCLALYLARKGFDVWISNNRGQTYSLGHIDGYRWYNPFSKYWDFSFHEMALYDFPAVIKYVKTVSGYEKVNYLGHSQGATQYFIKGIYDPDFLNNNIKSFIAIGPAIHLYSHEAIIPSFVADKIPMFDWMYSLGIGYFWVLPQRILSWTESLCRNFPKIYYSVIPTIGGFSKVQHFDLRRWPALCTKSPGGTSTKNLAHWMQLFRSNGKFLMFDYGRKNREVYGQESPKEYNISVLKNITVPTLIISGKRDVLITEESIYELMAELRNGREDQVLENIKLDDYAHLDFVWGRNAVKDFYANIARFVKQNTV